MDVAHDVGHHLAQSRGITGQYDLRPIAFGKAEFGGMVQIARRFEGNLHAANGTVRVERMQIVDGVGDQRREFHRAGHIDAAPLIETGQRQQILNKNSHALAGPFDMFDGLVRTLQGTRHIALHLIQLRIAMDGGQRGAQLMAGVGDEPFHLVGGLLLLMETGFYSGEHGIQRGGQRADLGVFRRGRNTLAQVAGCNFRGGLLDALQRRHRVLDDQRGQGAAEQHHGDADHNAVSGECVDGVDLVGQRQADVHHGTVLAVLLEGHRQNTPWCPRRDDGGMVGIGSGVGQYLGDGVRGIGVSVGRIVLAVRTVGLHRNDLLGHRLRSECLTERDAIGIAIGRQNRHRYDTVLHLRHQRGHDQRIAFFVFGSVGVLNLQKVRVRPR